MMWPVSGVPGGWTEGEGEPHLSGETAETRPRPEPEPVEGNGQALLRQVRKLIVLVVGGTVLLIGVAMLVLPGPAFVVIPAGIAILATEFAWARRLLRQVKARIRLAARKARQARAAKDI